MIDILSNLALWIITHGQTCAALALTFIAGGFWGMWIQFRNDDKKAHIKRGNADVSKG